MLLSTSLDRMASWMMLTRPSHFAESQRNRILYIREVAFGLQTKLEPRKPRSIERSCIMMCCFKTPAWRFSGAFLYIIGIINIMHQKYILGTFANGPNFSLPGIIRSRPFSCFCDYCLKITRGPAYKFVSDSGNWADAIAYYWFYFCFLPWHCEKVWKYNHCWYLNI